MIKNRLKLLSSHRNTVKWCYTVLHKLYYNNIIVTLPGTEWGYDRGMVLSKKHREQYPFVSGVPNRLQFVPRHLRPLMSSSPEFELECLTRDPYGGLCIWETCTGPGSS